MDNNNGHVAAWLPVASGFQSALIESAPGAFYTPPYVGARGWVGIELDLQITPLQRGIANERLSGIIYKITFESLLG